MPNSKQQKNTIGLVLPYLKSRGTEKQALRLAKGFKKKGAHVVLFVVQGWGLESMYQAFRDAGVKVVNVGKPETVGEKKINIFRLFSLAVLARKHGCNVLLSRAGKSNQICGWAGNLAFVPTILVLSGAVSAEKNNSLLKQLKSAIRAYKNYGFPLRIVSVSRESAANFAVSFPSFSKLIIAIPNGVDLSLEEKKADSLVHLNRGKFNICFSGSLELKRKGLDLLLEAMKYLVFESGLNRICLTLIGTGQDELKIRDLVIDYGLTHHVEFAGEQKNPYPIMKKCDVFVLPSRQEGMPNALLEALALGICCISADCNSGPREIIENGKNGILVPVENSRALAHAIARVEQDPFLRSELAQNGLKTAADKFSYQSMIDSYYALVMGMK